MHKVEHMLKSEARKTGCLSEWLMVVQLHIREHQNIGTAASGPCDLLFQIINWWTIEGCSVGSFSWLESVLIYFPLVQQW